MWFKYLLITLIFYIFTLLQISFLPYVTMINLMPNFIFTLFFILIFFDEKNERFFTALIAGFFLDLLLPFYFGVSIISILVIYFLHKLINYFFKKDQNKYLIFYFITIFSISFILYNLLLYLFSIIFHFGFILGWNIMMSLIYNLIFAIIGFYTYKKFVKQNDPENQLKLL